MRTFAPNAPNLQPGCVVHIRGEPYRVRRSQPGEDAWVIQLDTVTSRASADALRGEIVEVADADLRRDDADSYFVHELIGLRVVTVDGRDLGLVEDVLVTGANDVYLVRGPLGETLIPAIGDVVEAIDLPSGTMRITPMPGLLDESK